MWIKILFGLDTENTVDPLFFQSSQILAVFEICTQKDPWRNLWIDKFVKITFFKDVGATRKMLNP